MLGGRLEEIGYQEAGVGHQCWDAAIALSIYIRSARAPAELSASGMLEIGAGIGLPGIECSRRGKAVRLTDAREPIVELLERNCAAAGGAGTCSLSCDHSQ